MPEDSGFVHAEVRVGDGRVLIRSTCKFCGAERIVSREDGSLDRWESGHDCSKGSITQL